jgi:class 3 adenylate cyclase
MPSAKVHVLPGRSGLQRETVMEIIRGLAGIERQQAVSTVLATVHDTAGDGFFASFTGPARAIHCAHEVAERVAGLGIETRAGVHIGECEIIDGKPGGRAVTIGARLLGAAGPRVVVVSQTVKDLVAGSGTFLDRGERELKGVPDLWRLYVAEPTEG